LEKLVIILGAEEVEIALPMGQTIEAMKSAYAALSQGNADVPLRTQLNIGNHGGTSLFMPSYVHDDDGDMLALKTVSVFPNNPGRGMPIIHAAVLVFEANSGRTLALLEGGSLTAIRTGAASGAATDLLAKSDAKKVAIFGAGIQGRTQLEAVCQVRPIETAWIFDPDTDKANAYKNELSGIGQIPEKLFVAKDPVEAASQADIICTATTSRTPVYPANAVTAGTHINGVGSYTLEMIENPVDLFINATPFVDSIDAVLTEAGEIVEAIKCKILHPENMVELGKVVLGHASGRRSESEITYFKSVGIAVQDAFAARLAVQNAETMGLGQSIDW
jgi:ornithine cyclodeaminase